MKNIQLSYSNSPVCEYIGSQILMQIVLSNEKNMETAAFSARRCIFELKDRKLNPYHLIERMEYGGCNNAVRNITPKAAAALPEIEKMIFICKERKFVCGFGGLC